jgi:oxygen tolerance protein BatD
VSRVLLFLTVGLCLASASQGAEVSASLDRASAQVGDQVVLTVVATGTIKSVPDVVLHSLESDFDVYSVGQSTNVSIVNGQMTTQTSRQFVLVPKHPGTFTIGPLAVRLGNDSMQTEPLTLTVTTGPPPPSPVPGTKSEAGSTTGSEDLFVRTSVDKSTVYAYEQLTLRIRLYTRGNLLDNPGYTPPTTEGFWREDLPPPPPGVEIVDGKRYRVLEVRMAIFPTTPGTHTIGEAVLDCQVEDPTRQRDPFSSFFGGSPFEAKHVVLRSRPVTVTVKALPPGAPPGFQGAVGDFKLDVSADRREVNQNEPVTLTVRLSGEGHLRTIGELNLPATPEFRSYPSTENQQQSTAGDRIQGSVTRQFVLVPLKAGDLQLPPVNVAYFSPREGAYRTLTSQPITIHSTASAVTAPGSARSGIEVVGHDIRFIETDVPHFSTRTEPWTAAKPWLRLLPLPLLGYLGVWTWEERRRRQDAHASEGRRSRAARRARARLKKERGETGQIAERVGEVLRSYLADRYNLPPAGITPDLVEARLGEEGADPEPWLALLERTDAARYAPPASRATAAEWTEEAVRLIDAVERGA